MGEMPLDDVETCQPRASGGGPEGGDRGRDIRFVHLARSCQPSAKASALGASNGHCRLSSRADHSLARG